jgi:hypothetical protein
MDDRIHEVLEGPSAPKIQVWNETCVGCGGVDKLRIYALGPESAVGGSSECRGVLLCRTCSIARDLASLPSGPASGDSTRPINFWISRRLHGRLTNGIGRKHGFRSTAALVRYLMTKYVEDSSRFDDLEQWQDSGADVKVNVWVPINMYDSFKAITQNRGLTVTDALRGLIRLYEAIDGRIYG